MYRLEKEFSFSASHQLTHLRPDHPCARLHGHNWRVRFVLEADVLDPATGFVRDYRDLDPVKRWIDERLDHRHLNDVMAVWPTSEHVARMLYDRWAGNYPELVAVMVSETDKTWATYLGGPG